MGSIDRSERLHKRRKSADRWHSGPERDRIDCSTDCKRKDLEAVAVVDETRVSADALNRFP